MPRITDGSAATRKAHNAVNNGLRDGKVKKPKACQGCGKKTPRLQADHRDYRKPLDVKWLCLKCHAKAKPAKGHGEKGKWRKADRKK